MGALSLQSRQASQLNSVDVCQGEPVRLTIRCGWTMAVLSASIIIAAGLRAHARGQRLVYPTPTPSIRAIVAPPANAAGWHNTDVTIVFECRGLVDCPEAVVVTTEGAGQRVLRSAVDASGRTAQVEAVVNIDKSAGAVKILQSDQSADFGADLVSVTAEANDAVSGVAAAYCNGQSALLEGDAIRCAVPIRDGITDLVVSILDRAGNTASAGKELVRAATSSQVLLFPAAATLEVGATRPLYLSDTAWQPLHGRLWMADNTAIARVDDSTGEVTGVAAGETTIHGWTDDDRSSSMTLRVVGGKLPEGTAVWTAHHLAIGAATLPGTTTPMFMELDGGGGVSVSAFTRLGLPLWHELTSIRPGERVHTYGAMYAGPGVHTTMTDGTDSPLTWVDGESGRSAIVRSGHPHEGAIWRYEIASPATASWAFDEGARTLWAAQDPVHGYPYVDAIDSRTGALKFRVSLPITISAATTDVTETRQLPRPAVIGGAWVGDSGVNVPYATTEVVHEAAEGDPSRVLARRRVFVLHITSGGTVASEALLGFEASTVDRLPTIEMGESRTEGEEVLLVLMRVTYPGEPTKGVVMRRSGERITQYTLPTVGAIVSGEDHYYTADSHTLVAFDPTNGKVHWVHQSPEVFRIVYSVHGGGILIEKPSGKYVVTTDGVERFLSAAIGATR